MAPMKAVRAIVLGVAGLALVSCSTPAVEPTQGASSGPAAASAPPAASEQAPTGAPETSSSAAPVAAEPPALAIELVTDTLEDPISVTGSPDGWLIVNERAGRLVAVNPSTGVTAVALDITDRVQGGGEQGLLGFALHPDWPDVRRAFVHYSGRASDGDTVISELAGTPGTADAPPTFDAASEQILLEEEQPFPNHNGGQIAFGGDGYLYVGLGDGGSGGDPLGNGQNPSTLLGSILRVDVAESGSYTIPADNPFAGGAEGAPEVFLYGLRNPWRFSFDHATGMLWIADVGQNAFEEINRVDPETHGGANLGWNVMEASHCFIAPECERDGLLLPVAEYGRDLGCSVTGGHVYRGDAIAGLEGWYLFSDYCTGFIFGVPSDIDAGAGPAPAPTTLLETGLQVSSFGEGSDGELYIADLDAGALYRVAAGP
jgi:glucose/arabinose dehydrogenase